MDRAEGALRVAELALAEARRALQAVAEIKAIKGEPGEPGKDGADGKDGRDGLGVEDLDFVCDERGAFLRWANGKETKEVRLPIPLDRGVFKSDAEYQRGDSVTYSGSLWIAQGKTKGRPGAPGSEGWRLSVKHGRDGKDGKDGERGPPGPEGKPGRDLTQMGPDGAKW